MGIKKTNGGMEKSKGNLRQRRWHCKVGEKVWTVRKVEKLGKVSGYAAKMQL